MINKFKGDYVWLSNFYPVPVKLDGLIFPTLEHGYQAGKTLSSQIRERIRLLPTPAAAKVFGKRIGKSIPYRPAWSETFKVALMRYLLWQKFTNPNLRQRLISTGDEELVEGGNWHDRFFGRCYCKTCLGVGDNWLGRLLMEIRAECRAKDVTQHEDANWRLADAA